jgi:hypothetical protein
MKTLTIMIVVTNILIVVGAAALALLQLQTLRQKKHDARTPESRAFTLPPELQRILDSGRDVKLQEGPCRTTDGKTWTRAVEVFVDDELAGSFEVSWQGEYDALHVAIERVRKGRA